MNNPLILNSPFSIFNYTLPLRQLKTNPLLQTAIGRLRLTGFAEAISWLVLLLVAMPLKYIWHNPMPVKYVGWVHGVLFIAYVMQLVAVAFHKRWSFKKVALGVLAAFLPFGTLVFDKQLKEADAGY